MKQQTHVNMYLFVFVLLSILISKTLMASGNTPEERTRITFAQIETALSTLKHTNTLTNENVTSVLNKILLPEVDKRFFAKKVLGKHLSKVPDEFKNDFIQELSIQLIKTYSHLLSKYNGESTVIGQAKVSVSGQVATVNISIIGNDKTNKAVVKLIKSKEEVWYFFDIVVEGISLLDTKQKEISGSFNRLGIEGTLKRLKEINQ